MPVGKYKHKTGKDAANWKGGWKAKLPSCKVCGVRLSTHRAVCCRKHFKRKDQYGEKNAMWAGDKVKYIGLHIWVANILGKPSRCENCNSTTSKRYEWANLTKEYVRDISKWTRLCSSCHIKHDRYGHILTLEYKIDKININGSNNGQPN